MPFADSVSHQNKDLLILSQTATSAMSLPEEIQSARHDIVTDGYEMSIGEIINLYKDNELIINPNFQRYFVWSQLQKTRFIESLLLGIPIPPIFVYQDRNGVWELVDGLQRLSTILEFSGDLKNADGDLAPPLILSGTKMLPSLDNKSWEATSRDAEPIEKPQQLEIKRARLRVEILKKESDMHAKFELFQRLNTGGTQLKPQEVRNVVILMINKDFHDWVHDLASKEYFLNTIAVSDKKVNRQFPVELVIRFLVYRNIEYQSGLDVHEYLDDASIQLAMDDELNMELEKDVFSRTFRLLQDSMGSDAFKRWDGSSFGGMFLMSAFEVVAYGLSQNINSIESVENKKEFVKECIVSIWNDDTFQQNSGAGVRGTTRLRNLLPVAGKYFEVD